MRVTGGSWFTRGALVALVALASCSHARPRPVVAPLAALPEPRLAVRFTPQPDWYWEPVAADVRAAPKVVELPVAEGALARVEGGTRVWEELGAEGRERLRRDGLVVVGGDESARGQMGAFYTNLREQRVPYVVTLDALAYAVHVAFERALGEVDDTTLAPALDALLPRLEARLLAEQKGAGVELGEALGLARAVVAVARGLASADGAPPAASPLAASSPSPSSLAAVPSPPPLAAPLAPADAADVAQEIARIVAHAGPSTSPLLEAPIDYGRFAVPPAAARPGAFRAMTWLATAPLLLAARSEVPGGAVGVATSRLHTRAAMLLARLSLREIDPVIHAAWSTITRLLAFVWGPSDDLSPHELAVIASSVGVSLEDPKQIANVVLVDRVRHRAARGRTPAIFDGAGAAGRAGVGVRLFGGHAPVDSLALASLVGLGLGAATSEPPPPNARDGARTLPSTLDLAVWLGAKEARAALHESGADAFSSYDTVLARVTASRPAEDAPWRHASVHGSLLDAVMLWLAPSSEAQGALSSPAAHRAALESALAAWTFARHDGQPLTRARLVRPALPAEELAIKGAPLPAFVEAAPEVIARLVATVGQMKRGLAATGGLTATSPAMRELAEVEDLLRAALRVAERESNDEALTAEDATALAAVPARLARLEAGDGAMVPVVAELFVDAAGERSLSSATGLVEPAITIVREPSTGRLVLAVGAHVAHHELLEPRATRTTDATLRNSPSPARAAYTSGFRVVRGVSPR